MSTKDTSPTNKSIAYLCLGLKQLGVAALYFLCGYLVHHYIPNSGIVSVIWPSSGLALAALLIGGWRYIWGIFLGSLLLNVLIYDSPVVVAGLTLANIVESLAGFWLLTRTKYPFKSFLTLPDYLKLIVLGGGVASLIGSAIGVTFLMLAGTITPDNYIEVLSHRWMGHVIGIALVTTLLLAWRPNRSMQTQLNTKQLLESAPLIGLTFLVGQIVFLDWFHDSIGHIARGYWMFLFVSWVALRLGQRAVTTVMAMIGLQALLGALQGSGFFSDDLAKTGLRNYWYYMMILSLVGMALTTYVNELKEGLKELTLKNLALNMAANGIVITNVNGRIEWANQAFSHLTGYSLDEVYLRNPRELVKSGKQDQAYYQAMWDTILAHKVWSGEIINRRKDNSLYYEDMTITPMVNEQNEITHFVAVKQDITERKQAEKELHDSEDRFRFMLENSPIAVRITDSKTHQVTFANQRYAELINSKLDQVLGINPQQYYANPQDYADVLEQLNTGKWVTNHLVELSIDSVHSTTKWALASYLPIRFQNQAAILGWFYDISDRKQIEEKLRVSDRALKVISQGVIVTGADQTIISVNAAFETITGYSAPEILGQNCRFLQGTLTDQATVERIRIALKTSTEFSGEILNYRKDGSTFWNELTIMPVRDEQDQIVNFIGITRDITERKYMEEQVHQLAFYDPLTQLPNRRLLYDRLSQTMAQVKRSGCYSAVMILDLDNFKPLNDSHGHLVGDLLLIEVGHRLKHCVREIDTVARFGGDEFVVLLDKLDADNSKASAEARIIAEKIRNALSETYRLILSHEGQIDKIVEHCCSASIGVMVFTNHQGSQDDILNWADAAMYQAKDAGRNSIRFYESKV